NRDGRPELLVANYQAGSLTLYRNQSTAPATAPPPIPTALRLAPPVPNPASGPVVLALALPAAADPVLRVHDLAGRFVRSVPAGPLPAGIHSLRWDGRTAAGGPAPNGIYFLDVETAQGRRSTRVVVAR